MREPALSTPGPNCRSSAILAAGVDGALDPVERDGALKRLSERIRSESGLVISVSGQSLMAAFDTALEAFTCALNLQAASGETRSVRIGLAPEEIDALAPQPGAVVILAQQLRRAAPLGGIALPCVLYTELPDMVRVPATPVTEPIEGELAQPVPIVTIAMAACEAWGRQGDHANRAARAQRDDRLSLATVPFRAASSGAASFVEGVTDDVIRLLSGPSRWISVTRAPILATWGAADLLQVRQTCDARYILHGSADHEHGALRLAVELNEVATGQVLWSDRFDNVNGDAEALRDVGAPRIASAVAIALIQRELERIEALPPGTMTAQDIALRALAAIMQPERATFSAAGESLRAALSSPGPLGSIHYVTIIWHMVAIAQGWSRDPVGDAKAALAQSERLDRNDPASLALTGYVQALLHRDHLLACMTLDQVIDQAPFCAAAWLLKARVLVQMGEGADAVFHAEQAESLPVLGFDRAWRSTVTALAYYVAERYADAVRAARLAAMHHPGFAVTARVLAASLVVLGQLDEAQQAARRALMIDPGFRITTWRLQSMLGADIRERYAQRLRLAGLPE